MSWAGGEREPQHYRFAVKCDRVENAAIEAMARASGVSVTALVQAHFETIFLSSAEEMVASQGRNPDVVAARIASGRGNNSAPFAPTSEEVKAARALDITPGMLRTWRAMNALAVAGTYADGWSKIADRTGLPVTTVRVLVSRLVAADLLGRVRTGGYHIKSLGDE